MTRLYVFSFIVAVIMAAFFIGQYIGDLRCREHIAVNKSDVQNQIFQTMEDINAEVFHTATDDIRRVLHENYTIAE